MSTQLDYNALAKYIQRATTIFLTAHERPDGDALGSLVAMADYLRGIGKTVVMACSGADDPALAFLPHVKEVIADVTQVDISSCDLVIALDCAGLNRTRMAEPIAALGVPVVNIDHHATNDAFGDVNIVDAHAVATSEILYDFFKNQRSAISKNMATALLTGILTDSGNFTYAATSTHTFDAASDMLMSGASIRNILDATGNSKNLPTLQVWGLAMSRLQYDEERGLAYTVLTQGDIRKFGATTNDLDGLASFLNTLKDAKMVLVLYELGDGRVKGSFRTNRDDVDVSKLAQALGGGGHAKAAGFEVEGKLVNKNGAWQIV